MKEEELIKKVRAEFNLNLENQYPEGIKDVCVIGYLYEEEGIMYALSGVLIPMEKG